MDFVVSKVAMAVCALVVLAVLAGIAEPGYFVDGDAELRSYLDEFCVLAERGVLLGNELDTHWDVPTKADGKYVELSVKAGIVSLLSDQKREARAPQFGIHTWTWDGSCLNASIVEKLDTRGPTLWAWSGDAVTLETMTVLYEDSPTLMVFVRLC